MDSDNIFQAGRLFRPYAYKKEEFERFVVEHASHTFGSDALYVDIEAVWTVEGLPGIVFLTD